MFLIGIDYSAQEGKVGLAYGRLKGKMLDVQFAKCPETHDDVEKQIITWIKREQRKKNGAVLLAIDAPLGWPKSLIESLCCHKAGGKISELPDRMFMRATDRWVRDEIGKTPLKVGADKIAIQARHALSFLNKLRDATRPIPLAWKPGKVEGISVIEVYPAATLKGRHLRCTGYKGEKGEIYRKEIIRDLRRKKEMALSSRRYVTAMGKNGHVFDAVLCALAAADFVKNENDEVTSPENAKIDGARVGLRLAKKEGWIWVKKTDKQSNLV